MAEFEHIHVQAGPATPKGKVALWERHPSHPASADFEEGGEVFVAHDQKPKKVALTPEVALRLREERLVQVAGPDETKPAKKSGG